MYRININCSKPHLGGQFLRVGKAITTVDAILGGAAQPLSASAMAPMPTAAAVAAAAATAKIQAMETTEAPKVVVPRLGSPAVAVIPPPGNCVHDSTTGFFLL